MSASKRSRAQQRDALATQDSPASKRLKTTKAEARPTKSSLGFIVDEDARAGRQLSAKLTNGAPKSKSTRLDESKATIAPSGQNEVVGRSQSATIDISSHEEDSDDDVDDDDEETGADVPRTNGTTSVEADALPGADVAMADAEAQPEELSFGDMLQARHSGPIDVQAPFANPVADRQALIQTTSNIVTPAPSGTSLTTVLTQALKTNDRDLLESCFRTTNLPSVRATIERLHSQHVSTLLQRLAERIHKRPGRTGNLMVWVQWSLVAHGGYLASQPEVVKKLGSLAKVIRERSDGLKPLLHLKGKLDLLSAQLDQRRSRQSRSRMADAEDEDEATIYIEGDGDVWSDSEDESAQPVVHDATAKGKAKASAAAAIAVDSDDEEDLANGVVQEEDDVSEGDVDDEEGMFDDEAEETDDDDSDEEEELEEEDDVSDDASDVTEDESDGDVKQAKAQTLHRKR